MTHHRIAIIGAGFSGLGMAIRLKREGEEDFVILERAGEVGGTWYVNTYPGCRCDVPSHLYSFSFAPNPNWTSTFSPQPEILDYLRGCAERYGLLPHVRFHTELVGADWDDEQRVWRLETSQGELTADVLIAGQGGLSEPAVPDLPGLESFAGATFHSARWDHDHDLTGERVAVIGTGASAIQFVPEIQPRVGRLHVFQRTAPWVMPRPDRPLTDVEQRIYRRLPTAQLAMRAAIYWARETFVMMFRHPRLGKLAERMALRHLHAQVQDPELRRKVTPSFAIGCKRILPSDEWYPAITQPNVEVVTDGIREVRARSIVTSDGTEREVDTIVFGTGFHVTDIAIASMIRDRGGRSLAEEWNGSPEAYLGTTVSGYPNLFLLTGPNTGLGHNSIVFMIESQINYVAGALRALRSRGAATLEVHPEAQQAYNAELERRTRGTVWVTGGCSSYYIDRNGHNSTLWPTFTWPFRQRTRRFDEAAYSIEAVPSTAPGQPAPVPAGA
ncbi:MAG TPA: NAD(P)/FAD-dependent oxidoreductase [Thermoleophilaceae bacterium]|nr:NAD(P)/FAD-dependent oxidoreductase [Thermoleophilaceae bacterium]